MKIDPRRVDAFLADPGPCRVVLLFGEDSGLVHERGSALVRAVAGSLDDPFRVAELEREGLARLADEHAAQPMTGGRRVVRVRDVTDAAAGPVQAVLGGKSEGLAVLEAGELPARSKLRALIDAAPAAASIACYSEQGPDLARTIAAALAQSGLTPTSAASDYLAQHLGNDRAVTRQELAKLALYVHPATGIDIDDAMAVIGDLAGLQIEDALFAATAGDVETADRALEQAMAEGANPISVLRSLLNHLVRLQRVRLAVDDGQPASEAVRALRPPIFFRRQPSLSRAAALWTEEQLAAACAAVFDAERACKRTGAPSEAICRHTLGAIARRAAARRRA